MHIIFVTADEGNYLGDPLYIGLSRVLGAGNVIDYPFNQSLHNAESSPWYFMSCLGRRYNQQKIIELLEQRHFDLVCLAYFRKEW